MPRPTHNLVIRQRVKTPGEKGAYSKCGVAWLDDETGNIGIRLHDGVVLDWRMNDTHTISAYLVENARQPEPPRRQEPSDAPTGSNGYDHGSW